jgi:hypothetical protein
MTVPYARPGRGTLLRISRWRKVDKALQAIDAIEAASIPPMRHEATDGISTIVCPFASARGSTRGLGIKPGCVDGS